VLILKKLIPSTMFSRLFSLVFLSVSVSHLSFMVLVIKDLPPPPPREAFIAPPPREAFIAPPSPLAIRPTDRRQDFRTSPKNFFWFSLAIQFVLVVIAARYGSRMMVKPIEEFAQAAARLSHDLNSPPILEKGSEEAIIAIKAFNKMQTKIVQDIEARARFLAAVSHDLRTPITRLRLRLETLSLEHTTATKLQTDINEMTTLIDATLDFLRTDSEQADWQLIDVNTLLQAIVDDVTELGMSVELQGSAKPIMGLSIWLRRAIQNLIENGVRYGNRVEVHVVDAESELYIAINDFGEGIPEPYLVSVMEPFVRLEESRNKNTGGVGLGLSIAAEAVRCQNGELKLANKPDGGLSATIVLKR
jgi:signal transduction histidine kinase